LSPTYLDFVQTRLMMIQFPDNLHHVYDPG